MPRWVRAFLVWVMVIAMPLQGLAASTMRFCGPSHQRMAQGLVLQEAAAGRAHGHDHAQGGSAAGHAAHGHADAHGPDAPPAPQGAGGAENLGSHHGKFNCSACAACCSVLALPAEFALPEASSPGHPVRMAPVAAIASLPPDGLDRPPRSALG